MKKLDIGQAITILANLGVIAGIVFLVVELQQNNRLMEAEARNARNLRVVEIARDLYSVPGMAELFVKVGNGEELTEAEEYRMYAFNMRRLRGMEAQYREFREGNFEVNVQSMRIGFRGGIYNAPMNDAWERAKPIFSEDFVQWMEENVVNER